MYDIEKWCDKRFVPSSKKRGWYELLLCKGDARASMDVNFSPYTQKRLGLVLVRGVPYTAITMKAGDMAKWRRAERPTALRNCIGSVMAEKDGRRFFPAAYARAEQAVKIAEMSRQRQMHKAILAGFSARNTVRGAATDSI